MTLLSTRPRSPSPGPPRVLPGRSENSPFAPLPKVTRLGGTYDTVVRRCPRLEEAGPHAAFHPTPSGTGGRRVPCRVLAGPRGSFSRPRGSFSRPRGPVKDRHSPTRRRPPPRGQTLRGKDLLAGARTLAGEFSDGVFFIKVHTFHIFCSKDMMLSHAERTAVQSKQLSCALGHQRDSCDWLYCDTHFTVQVWTRPADSVSEAVGGDCVAGGRGLTQPAEQKTCVCMKKTSQNSRILSEHS